MQDKASSPDKFWSAIKKLYPTKITKGSAAAININGTKTSNTSSIAQGPVVRRPISANPGLDFNPGFDFNPGSKTFSAIIFSLLFRASNHQL